MDESQLQIQNGAELNWLTKLHKGSAAAHSIMGVWGRKLPQNSDNINTPRLQVQTFQECTREPTEGAAKADLPTVTVQKVQFVSPPEMGVEGPRFHHNCDKIETPRPPTQM